MRESLSGKPNHFSLRTDTVLHYLFACRVSVKVLQQFLHPISVGYPLNDGAPTFSSDSNFRTLQVVTRPFVSSFVWSLSA
jgi:hypothetical protein